MAGVRALGSVAGLGTLADLSVIASHEPSALGYIYRPRPYSGLASPPPSSRPNARPPALQPPPPPRCLPPTCPTSPLARARRSPPPPRRLGPRRKPERPSQKAPSAQSPAATPVASVARSVHHPTPPTCRLLTPIARSRPFLLSWRPVFPSFFLHSRPPEMRRAAQRRGCLPDVCPSQAAMPRIRRKASRLDAREFFSPPRHIAIQGLGADATLASRRTTLSPSCARRSRPSSRHRA